MEKRFKERANPFYFLIGVRFMSGARIWFYFASEAQVGPMSLNELQSSVQDGLVSQQDYIFKDGYKDWIFAKDVPELAISFQLSSTLAGSAAAPTSITSKNVAKKLDPKKDNPGVRSLRVMMQERVVAHNESKVTSGKIENISTSGVFFHTPEEAFGINDSVKLTLKEGKGLGKPVQLQGVIVRKAPFTKENVKYIGYGIELKALDESSRQRIEDYINRHKAS
jgi:PilZ domain/GYF domain 2